MCHKSCILLFSTSPSKGRNNTLGLQRLIFHNNHWLSVSKTLFRDADLWPLSREAALVSSHPLTCVRPDVSLEQPRPGESFPAYFAHARQSVSPDVHFEGSEADVLLLAVFTTEGFPRLGVAVQLFVLEESRVRGVGLATQTTLEFLCLHSVRVCQLREHVLVVVAPRAFRAAVVFGGGVGERRRVSRDGGQVTGERTQRQAGGSPHCDGTVGCRAQDLRLGDEGQGKALIDVRREEHWKQKNAK